MWNEWVFFVKFKSLCSFQFEWKSLMQALMLTKILLICFDFNEVSLRWCRFQNFTNQLFRSFKLLTVFVSSFITWNFFIDRYWTEFYWNYCCSGWCLFLIISNQFLGPSGAQEMLMFGRLSSSNLSKAVNQAIIFCQKICLKIYRVLKKSFKFWGWWTFKGRYKPLPNNLIC